LAQFEIGKFFWQKSWSISSWRRSSGLNFAEVESSRKFGLRHSPSRIGGGRRGMGAEIGLHEPPSGNGVPGAVLAEDSGVAGCSPA